MIKKYKAVWKCWSKFLNSRSICRAVLRGSPRWRPNGRDMFSSWFVIFRHTINFAISRFTEETCFPQGWDVLQSFLQVPASSLWDSLDVAGRALGDSRTSFWAKHDAASLRQYGQVAQSFHSLALISSCSPGLEELASVALPMSTKEDSTQRSEKSTTSISFSCEGCHIENTKSRLSVFGLSLSHGWLVGT